MAPPAATPASTDPTRAAPRDHGFHELRIEQVVGETEDAASLVLAVPPELEPAFAYAAGQFCTFRVWIDGEPHLRCYSMSSSPDVGDQLQVTVKRVPGGVVSNWMLDRLGPGDAIEATCPSGVFCLGAEPEDGSRELVAFAGGSGITPVLSLVKTALATTDRRIRLLYANRDRDSIIFRTALDELTEQHPHRLDVRHHLDVERGFLEPATVRQVVDGLVQPDVYICGPGPFMDIVEHELLEQGPGGARIHIERFTPAGVLPVPPPDGDAAATVRADGSAGTDGSDVTEVTIELDGKTDATRHHPGTTILQTARQLGMAPPFSCESGSCATCMARVLEGSVEMHVNNALTDEEVSEGWVLTCQAVPTSPSVHVVYGFDN